MDQYDIPHIYDQAGTLAYNEDYILLIYSVDEEDGASQKAYIPEYRGDIAPLLSFREDPLNDKS
jgi:hypothetical protein